MALGGSSLRQDLGSTQGQRLSQLHSEACSLNVVLARSNRDGYRTFNTSCFAPVASGQDATPDWLEMGVRLWEPPPS